MERSTGENFLPLRNGQVTLEYPLTIEPDNNGYLVTFRDIPIVDHCDTKDEARINGRNALIAYLKHMISEHGPIPISSTTQSGEESVFLTQIEMAKLRRYRLMREQRLTNIALAKRLNQGENQVRRLLSLKHNSTVSQLEQAFRALGRQMLMLVA